LQQGYGRQQVLKLQEVDYHQGNAVRRYLFCQLAALQPVLNIYAHILSCSKNKEIMWTLL